MKVEPGNILKLFLNFSNFEPQYSYRLYSYKKKSVIAYFVSPVTGILQECRSSMNYYLAPNRRGYNKEGVIFLVKIRKFGGC